MELRRSEHGAGPGKKAGAEAEWNTHDQFRIFVLPFIIVFSIGHCVLLVVVIFVVGGGYRFYSQEYHCDCRTHQEAIQSKRFAIIRKPQRH